MISKTERFWISFILRFAFGFFFLIAAVNIFNAGGGHDFGPDWFARTLSKPFALTWVGDLLPEVDIVVDEPEAAEPAAGKTADAQGVEESAPAPAGAAKAAAAKAPAPKTEKVHPTYFFLYALPFIFAALSVPILTGVFLRPALRLGALLLVVLGLGKYIASSNDLSTTAYDFLFAFLICVGLYFLGQEKQEDVQATV